MRLPHAPESQELAHQTAPEIAAPPPPRAPIVHEDELITRPGWPLPGDLEAWESADLGPAPAPAAPAPAFGQWAEIAAARTEQPVRHRRLRSPRPGGRSRDHRARRPVSRACRIAPGVVHGRNGAAGGSLSEPPFRSFGDGVDDLGEPARAASPSTDPSFWEVGPASEPAAPAPEPRVRPTARRLRPGRRRLPRAVRACGVPVRRIAEPSAPESGTAPEPPGQVGPDDWWASDATSVIPEPTAVPDARSLPHSEQSGMQRPAVTAAVPQEADWWDTAPAAPTIPAGEDWWTTPAAPSPVADVTSPVEPAPTPPTARAPELVGATAVATGAAGVPGGTPGRARPAASGRLGPESPDVRPLRRRRQRGRGG